MPRNRWEASYKAQKVVRVVIINPFLKIWPYTPYTVSLSPKTTHKKILARYVNSQPCHSIFGEVHKKCMGLGYRHTSNVVLYSLMESSRQEECRTPVTEYHSAEAGNGKDLTRTGTILLSTDIDRSTEHQYMDMPTDRTQPDLATRKQDENLLQLVEKRQT